MPHAALWVVQRHRSTDFIGRARVSMPHAALWVVQLQKPLSITAFVLCFNAARGFVGGAAYQMSLTRIETVLFQCRTRLCGWCSDIRRIELKWGYEVSMPHAALWVVQHSKMETKVKVEVEFQCRTRLCGWCSFVARSPCPPRGKKPFWKVSGNLSVLTENM